MSYFKRWTKKIKIAFIIRVLSMLLTIGILVGIVAANGQIILLLAGGSFIASIVILVLLLVIEIFGLYKFLTRVNNYYKNWDKVQEASKDPIISNDLKVLRDMVETLDLETIETIRALKNKENIPGGKVTDVLSKTKNALKTVENFELKYPNLKPLGIKDPKMLIVIYTKRISLLSKNA